MAELKAKVGRPPKLTPEQRIEVFEAFKQYIIDTDDPTLVGFVATHPLAIQYEISRENIYDWTEFSPLVKRGIQKQEHYLLKNVGTYNPAMAIFRLKQPQHGYIDKINQEQSGEQKLIVETRVRSADNDN